MDMTCKQCKHFTLGQFAHKEWLEPSSGVIIEAPKPGEKQTHGQCLNPKLSSDHVNSWTNREHYQGSDGVIVTSYYDDDGILSVGVDFGCIHFEPKT